MNDNDKKINDLLSAYARKTPSEVFVRRTMNRIRQEQAAPSPWSWLRFPRLALAGAAFAALLLAVAPRLTNLGDTTPEPTLSYALSLMESPSDIESASEPDTETLIETYFL